MNNKFWDKFYEQPLDKIPWQNTQADWFKELVDKGEITGKSALDLGCGTGIKSIYLAKHGFERVLGVDISPRAVEIAKSNAASESVSGKCNFEAGDISSPGFSSSGESFDFILDWAAIHCIPADRREVYSGNIEKCSRPGSLFLMRAFSSDAGQEYFEEEIGGEKSRIYFLSIDGIKKLFPKFEITGQNKSLPRTKQNFFFTEVLMKRT